MNFFWLDSSAIAKRYIPETGTPLINHLFSRVHVDSLVCLLECVGEVISVFVRCRNGKVISPAAFRRASSRFDSEIAHQSGFEKVYPTKLQVAASWKLIRQHSINSTDAIILKCALDKAAEMSTVGNNLVLISADSRLVRAAKAEGLITFNPETDDQQTLDSLIN